MAATEEIEKEILAEMAANPVPYAAGQVNDVITIDGETRMISVPASEIFFGVESDKDVERKHFRCPKVVGDGIDLSKHQIYISYITSDSAGKTFSGNAGLYLCEDVATDGDDITFSWQLSGNVFASAGFIAFKVLAAKTDGENVQTRWNTVPAIGTVLMTVPDGMDIGEAYPDIVTQLLERMASVEKIATEEAMQGYVNTYLEAHPGEIDETLTDPKKAAPASVVGELKEDLSNQKVVPMASINPCKMNLEDYDAVITPGKYLTGRYTDTHVPSITEESCYPYDIVDIKINHDNATITVPYDASQNVGQAFVLYTKGVNSNNATPDNVNKKQVGVIEVTSDSYTVNLNADPFVYDRVAFTVPKGRRDFYFSSPEEGELGKLINKRISISNEELISKSILTAPVNMFYSIGAIGDSYTAGSALASDGKTWQDVTELSWIATMGKRAGIYWSNYGKGGATTKSYITDKLPDVLSGQAKDLYFIDLGINDYLQNIMVGTISDIKENYAENGESYFGWYGSIIAQVQAHAPKAKIVLVKIWTVGAEKIPYDNAIDDIAEHFGLPVINPFDDFFFNSSLYLNNMVSGHPTPMTYSSMGLAMERLFSRCVTENQDYFKYATIS